ncbi:MAG: hypothetical protein H8K11_01510 [Nitrospira sp.]|nr:hypothetical protein [Nitrospira sp.]
MSDEAVLSTRIDPSGFQQGAATMEATIQRISNSWVGMSAKVFVFERTMEQAWRVAKQGAEFDETLARLNRQAGVFNQTADHMVSRLKSVTGGQLSMAEAAEIASKGLMQSMNPDQIEKMAAAGEVLSDVYGGTVKSSIDELLQSTATMSSRSLQAKGIYIDLEETVRRYAVSTNRTVEQISKQERATLGANAILESLDKTMQKVGDSAPSSADKMAEMEARLKDMGNEASRLSTSLLFLADQGVNYLYDKLTQLLPIIGEGEKKFNEFFSLKPMALDKSLQGKSSAEAFQLDPKLRAIQAEGSAERMRAQIEAERNSTISGLQHQSRLLGFDQQQGQQGVGAGVGALDFLKAQQDAKLRELALEGETQSKLLQLETETYHARIALGFETTEEKIKAEETYKTKVASINAEVAKSVQEFNHASTEFLEEQKVLQGSLQEQMGRQITDGLISTFKVEEDLRHKSQDDTIAYYQNLAKFQEAYGTSRENQLTTQYDLVRATLAKELDVTFETAEKVLNAWRNGDSIRAAELLENTRYTWDQVTTIMMGALADQRAVSEKFSDDFFGGFAKSMKRYVQDQSMFGLGADQARSVAQAMQQSFKTFFFDAMEGKVKGLKDVLQGLTDFMKNMVADVGSKLISRSLLTGLDALPGLFSSGGGAIPAGGFNAASLLGMKGFADGGITDGPAIAGEGRYREAIVPLPNGRSIPVEWRGDHFTPQRPSTTMSMPVTVNVHNSANADVQTETRQGPDGNPQIDVFINNVVKRGMRNGEYDPFMKQFGANRVPVRRG